MQIPRTPCAGIQGVRVLSLGSDTRILTEADHPNQAYRAVELDRAADHHLHLGQHCIAKRLARLAAEIRLSVMVGGAA